MKKNKWESWFILQIFAAVLLGTCVGIFAGPKAQVLGELGALLIKLLKALATPLIFFAIVDAFCKTEIRLKGGLKLLLISFVNACFAGAIALSIAALFPIRDYVNLASLQANGFTDARLGGGLVENRNLNGTNALSHLVPQTILEPFIQNNVLSVILLSVMIGLALRTLRKSGTHAEEFQTLQHLSSSGLQLISLLLRWVVRGVPIAVFGVVAQMVGKSGFQLASTLGIFVAWIAFGLFLHAGVYYSILLAVVARVSPLHFFRQAGEALMTAFGTGSSLATLPVTLRTLQDKMKISPESSRLAACIGTNLNHDGILLYEAAAAIFIAQVHGIPLDFSQKALILGTSALAAVGIAGVPDAGLITLSLVLTSVGLPLSWVPVLMTVDWFIGRLRATVNVTSDMVVATLLDR
jgi:Na+/H+-dicarboxylate symporter